MVLPTEMNDNFPEYYESEVGCERNHVDFGENIALNALNEDPINMIKFRAGVKWLTNSLLQLCLKNANTVNASDLLPALDSLIVRLIRIRKQLTKRRLNEKCR